MPPISFPLPLVAIAIVLLAGIAWLVVRQSARRRQGLESLRRAKVELEAEVSKRANELLDSRARLQSIIDSAVDAIIVIDAKGCIESFNRGAERLFGYPGAEVIGRNVNILMPSPDHEQHDDYLARYTATGEANIIGIGREVTGRRRDGTTFPIHLSVGEMSIGGRRKFTGVLHDLSERVRLEERLRSSEARWRSIVESAVDGIVVIDAYGRIEAFNPAAERLFRSAAAGSSRPERQHPDAIAVRRGARHLPRAVSLYWCAEDHRDRTRGRRPSQGWDDVSGASVGRRNDDDGRTKVYRYSPRPERASASRNSCRADRRWRGSARWRP